VVGQRVGWALTFIPYKNPGACQVSTNCAMFLMPLKHLALLRGFQSPIMSEPKPDEQVQLLGPLLEYGCTSWRASSQRVADLYESGVKLWKKEDLVDIEQQLTQSYTAERFKIRRIDGSLVYIKNPMFGIQRPIWYLKYLNFKTNNSAPIS
jgi:hypothetical protein